MFNRGLGSFSRDQWWFGVGDELVERFLGGWLAENLLKSMPT
jgi:hypothetical protein